MELKRSDIFKLIALGAGSGVLSFLSQGWYFLDNVEFYLPGLFFGLVVWGYFFFAVRGLSWNIKQLAFFVFFVAVSTGSYFLALLTGLFSNSLFGGLGFSPHPLSFLVAGMVGALLLSIGFHFLVRLLSWWRIIVLSLVGGLLGLSFFIPQVVLSIPEGDESYFSLLLFWQAGMAGGFGWAVRHSDPDRTPWGKLLILVFLLILPFAGFLLGMEYQKMREVKKDTFPPAIHTQQEDKYYVGDIETCALIEYECPEGYIGFSDIQGCGCEKVVEEGISQSPQLGDACSSFEDCRGIECPQDEDPFCHNIPECIGNTCRCGTICQ